MGLLRNQENWLKTWKLNVLTASGNVLLRMHVYKRHFTVLKNDALHLDRNHPYYIQVQGAMAITGVSSCDFVVWTPYSVMIEEIHFYQELWENEMFPNYIHNFYINYMLLVILY